MKKGIKTTVVISVTIIISFSVAAYLARKETIKAMVNETIQMEVFNEVGRVESWDRIEQLLIKGCNKEALELVRLEQSMVLSGLKDKISNNIELENMLKERNSEIAVRAENAIQTNTSTIPSCKDSLTRKSSSPVESTGLDAAKSAAPLI